MAGVGESWDQCKVSQGIGVENQCLEGSRSLDDTFLETLTSDNLVLDFSEG